MKKINIISNEQISTLNLSISNQLRKRSKTKQNMHLIFLGKNICSTCKLKIKRSSLKSKSSILDVQGESKYLFILVTPCMFNRYLFDCKLYSRYINLKKCVKASE
uniref:Uncharacterized protein n=1 Tax=Cacopsylla melanoneura TaxID=428564 RepID=A0A8D8RKY1_9HEMI